MFEMMVGIPPFFYGEDDSYDSAVEKLEHKILNDEPDFPDDMSMAAISIVKKVSAITIKSEALKCHSLLYALELLATFSLKTLRTGLILSVQEFDTIHEMTQRLKL